MESFIWVLACITIAKIEYKGGTVKISPLPDVDVWFKDDNLADCHAHISLKRFFHLEYSCSQQVFEYHIAVQR